MRRSPLWAERKAWTRLVSNGGGSVIDTAKGANILLGVGGNLLDDWQGTHLVPEPLKKHIAIPTTAGTGAEVSLGAVIKNSASGQKISFNSKYLLPDVAILDPVLTGVHASEAHRRNRYRRADARGGVLLQPRALLPIRRFLLLRREHRFS